MSFRLDTATELRSRWLPIIERQYALTLAPLDESLGNVRVKFAEVRGNGACRYRCAFSARFVSGELLELVGEHHDGRIAVGDTFSRARRAISRRRRRLAERMVSRAKATR